MVDPFWFDPQPWGSWLVGWMVGGPFMWRAGAWSGAGGGIPQECGEDTEKITTSSSVLFIWTLPSFHSFNGKNCISKHIKTSSCGSKIMQLRLCLVNSGRNKVVLIQFCVTNTLESVSSQKILVSSCAGQKCFYWWAGLRLIDNYGSFTQCHLFSGISLLTLKGEETKNKQYKHVTFGSHPLIHLIYMSNTNWLF